MERLKTNEYTAVTLNIKNIFLLSSQGPSNTVTANFSIFFNPAVREMSMAEVGTLFTSNLATENGQSVLEPQYELSNVAPGLYIYCTNISCRFFMVFTVL